MSKLTESRRPYYVAFGAKLRQKRQEAGLSCRAVAQGVGISKTSIIRYENATQAPTKAVIEALAKFFGVNAEELFALIADAPAPQNSPRGGSVAAPKNFVNEVPIYTALDLLSDLRLLNESGLRKVIDYARDLTGNAAYLSDYMPNRF